MKVIYAKKELESTLSPLWNNETNIGFVPTMGALHEGHLSLIEKAVDICDKVVISIFVNPTQFNNLADLQKYPRTLEADLQKLQYFTDLIIFAPEANEIYGATQQVQSFDFGGLEKPMEGATRPGHFEGVGTVLKKLFTLIKPQKAFFGEKDYQQLLIVKKLIEIEQFQIEIVGCPIDREPTGLARSSRNNRLTTPEREEATLLYKSLKKAKKLFKTVPPTKIKEIITADFDRECAFKLVYFEIAEAETLKPVIDKTEPKKTYRAFLAAWIGGVRLIDNMQLN